MRLGGQGHAGVSQDLVESRFRGAGHEESLGRLTAFVHYNLAALEADDQVRHPALRGDADAVTWAKAADESVADVDVGSGLDSFVQSLAHRCVGDGGLPEDLPTMESWGRRAE